MSGSVAASTRRTAICRISFVWRAGTTHGPTLVVGTVRRRRKDGDPSHRISGWSVEVD